MGLLTEAGRGEREVRRPRGEGGQHSWDLLGNNGSRVALGQVLRTGGAGEQPGTKNVTKVSNGPLHWRARGVGQASKSGGQRQLVGYRWRERLPPAPARTPCTADSGDGEPAAGTAFPSDPSARPQPRPQGKTRLRASGHSWGQAEDLQCAPRMPNRPPPPLPRGRQFPVLTRLRTSRADFTNC